MKPIILTCVLAVAASASGQTLSIHTDFPGGSAEVLEVNAASRLVRIAPGGSANRGWVCWWYLRIDGAEPGQPLTLEVNASTQPTRRDSKVLKTPLAAGWSMPARAAISDDGRTWRQTAPGNRENNRIRYEIVPAGASVWLAWGPPLTPDDVAQLLPAAAAKIPGATPFELVKTHESRPVMGLRIAERSNARATSPPRPGVWIQARQHAWESGGSWVARGVLEWITSDDEAARQLRSAAEIVIVPIMDVDNAATGNGGKEANPWDHNRDWDDKPVFPEVAAAQQQLLEWAKQGRLDFFIDLHNPAPQDLRPFFFVGPPEFLQDPGRANRALFLEIAHKHMNGRLPVEPAPRVTGPDYHPLWRKISGQWVTDHGNPHTVAVCLETSWNTPHSTTEGYQQVGQQLGRAIAEYIQRRQR